MDHTMVERLLNLLLTKEEEKEIPIKSICKSDLLEECSLSLFGRLLADRDQNQRVLKNTLRSASKIRPDLQIVDVGNNILQFRFSSEYQMKWVEQNGPWKQMDGFRKVVDYYTFQDLGYCGFDFTWCNMQGGDNIIYLRLDRAFTNLEWTEKFGGMKVHHLVDSTSDHSALLVSDSAIQNQTQAKHFHFEAMWTKNAECKAIIENSWGMEFDLNTPDEVMANLSSCAAELTNWSSKVFRQIPKKIQAKRNALNSLTLQDKDGALSTKINCIRREINDLLNDKKIYWGQRAKAHWLKEGNKNTRFFHAQALERRKQSTIMGIWDSQGRWKDGYMTTKLDMSKAVDRVEWCFIQGVMEKLGFSTKWVNLVMRCITLVLYSVIINDATCGNIIPTRGLRQGGLLSPTLFLICTNGLSAPIHEVAQNQHLIGISICKGCPRVTHLLFVNDSILFYKASAGESQELKQILQKYEAASGQKINTDKSSVFFNPNTSQEVKDEIFATLGPMQDTRHTRYLSLPSFIGRSKKQVSFILKERIGQKLDIWKGKLLSMGGKEILIKVVAQSIPTYTTGCFLLPQSLCDEIESMMRNFW
ncbi:uncharacterized protein LOC142633021 [Castanea sativa]|uniref:uncharacterized protein LOC142633021 n=1 Tax=Castanea sativa TaxID=21020 RepID=UPI003F64DB8E